MLMSLSAARAARATVPAFAWGHWTSFVHHKNPAHEFLAVTSIYGLGRCSVVVDLHKPESTGLTSEPVAHYGYGIDGHATFSEEILQILFVGGIWEISYKKLLH
jgi:hypothetical protein